MSLNAAIIGLGGMGSWHLKSLNDVDEINVTAMHDINPKKVKKAAETGLKGYFKLEDLLADSSIDMVIVSTPNNFHKEITIKALKAGKHVICEKPVMMNSGELEEVIKVAADSGKVFSVHQNRRWDTDFRKVKKVIEDGTIGKPFYIESRVQGSKGIPGDWRCVKAAGGGMLLDWGVHMIDQLMWLVDSPVTEIYAHLLSVVFPEVDDNFKLMLKFENGLSALVEVDTYTFINLPRWHVSGDQGTMVINDWGCNGCIKKANLVEFKWEEGIVYTSAGPTKTMAPRPLETIDELPLPKITSDANDYYRNFAAAVNGSEQLIVTPQQALRVLKVIDAVFESSEKGICIKGSF